MPSVRAIARRPLTWIVVAALLAAYAAAGFWLVPRLVTAGVRDAIATRYHRDAKLGKVTFNPFTFELNAAGFALPDADGGLLASFDHLRVDLDVVSVVRGGLDFRAITLAGPRLHLVRRADGRLNLLDFAPPPDKTAKRSAPPPRIWIDEFAVRGGEVTVTDLARREPLKLGLRPVTFTLHNFSTRSDGNAYALSALSTSGESLDWHGTFGLAPLESRGSFALGHVKVETLAAIAGDQLPFQLSSGQLELKGDYELNARDGEPSLKARIAELVLGSLGVRAVGDAEDAVLIPKLTITDAEADVGARTIVVGHVRLDQPRLTAERSRDGTISLERLVRHSAGTAMPAPAAPPPTPAGPAATGGGTTKPWTVSVPDIRVSAGTLELADRTPRQPAIAHVAALDLSVAGFAVPARGPLTVELGMRINERGRIDVKGDLTLSPLTAHLAIDAADLPLTAIQPYLDGVTALTLRSGTAGAKGKLVLGPGPPLDFDGDAAVDDLRTVDNVLAEDFVKWRSLQIRGLRVRTAPLAVRIREIATSEPYARVTIGPDGGSNLRAVLAPGSVANAAQPATTDGTPAAGPAPAASSPSPTKANAPEPAAARALPVEIGVITITGGSANFADFSIKPNFVTGIQDLAGTVRGLSGKADARADVKLEGKVDRYAPVTIDGKVNYLAAVSYTDLKVGFRNMELTSLSPYSGKFAGYRIDKGKLSVDFSYLVENRKLTAKHKLVINQLQLGERIDSADATKLPVKLAIALLKDRNGVIDLDLPVSGSLDDPQFRLGPIIWKIVVNLITKIVTSPFALLGSLFGGGEEMSFVDFPAGIALLDAAAKGKLQALAKALDSRPALNLDIPLVVQPEADRAALLETRWRESVMARAVARLGGRAVDPGAVEALLANPKDYRALLEDAYRQTFGHRPDMPKAASDAPPAPPPDPVAWLEAALRAAITIGQVDLDTLAQARAVAVQSLLLDGTGIDPTRVFVINSPPLPAGSPVRMQLALH